MKKRFFSLLLALLLFCSAVPVASAAADDNGQSENAAEMLYTLGLFKGTGVNPDGTPIFDLDKAPTRDQGLIMLIRLLGKEQEALAGTWDIPFTDVSDFMRPYVGYAYANGLTNGTSATTFGGSEAIQTTHYIVFVLRALGYKDNVDFQWDTACDFAREIALDRGGDYTPSTPFDRGDVAFLSRNALALHLKGSKNRLLERICDKPLDPELPITQESFFFLFPYSRISGDVFGPNVAHGNPETDRCYTLIINGSIVRDGYTVTCPASDFCNIELLEDGRFRVESLRPGLEKIQVTYGDVTVSFDFLAWAPVN